ncbi:MAG: lysozyme inhibitor LprI family protein [Pseudomonadota bacterium]
MRLALILVSMLASAATAEEPPAPADVAALETCMAEQLPATDRAEAACIRRLAEPCMGTAEGGTTLGTVDCLFAESAAWDVILNADWPELMARARSTDGSYAGVDPPPPSAAKTLRTAQRAWLAWREAECAARAAEWGNGSLRHVIYADCWLALTAKRTIALHARLREEP